MIWQLTPIDVTNGNEGDGVKDDDRNGDSPRLYNEGRQTNPEDSKGADQQRQPL